MSRPSGVLGYPYPVEPIPAALNEILDVTSWLTPSEYLRKGIEFVFHFNPGEIVGEWVAGDWHGMSVASSALTQLAEYTQALGRAVHDESAEMMLDWQGHAASSAAAYFENLAITVDQLNEPLRGLAKDYQTVAAGMLEMAESVGNLMHDMEDKLIEMGIKAAAAVALSETVVGSLIAGAWAISDAKKVLDMWREAQAAYELAVTIADAVVGTTAGYLGALDTGDGLELPGAYANPGLA